MLCSTADLTSTQYVCDPFVPEYPNLYRIFIYPLHNLNTVYVTLYLPVRGDHTYMYGVRKSLTSEDLMSRKFTFVLSKQLPMDPYECLDG
jgi:hypothetical protein